MIIVDPNITASDQLKPFEPLISLRSNKLDSEKMRLINQLYQDALQMAQLEPESSTQPPSITNSQLAQRQNFKQIEQKYNKML